MYAKRLRNIYAVSRKAHAIGVYYLFERTSSQYPDDRDICKPFWGDWHSFCVSRCGYYLFHGDIDNHPQGSRKVRKRQERSVKQKTTNELSNICRFF